jgi:hypothetical protein
VAGPTQVPISLVLFFAYGTLTLCRLTFQSVPLKITSLCDRPYNPENKISGLGFSPFARRY